MFGHAYLGARYFGARYFGGAVEVAADDQPLPQQHFVFSGARRPIEYPRRPVPPRITAGNALGRLPGLSGEALGEALWLVEGDVAGDLPEVTGVATGEIPVFGLAEAAVGLVAGEAAGSVKFLHDDEEALLLLLVA